MAKRAEAKRSQAKGSTAKRSTTTTKRGAKTARRSTAAPRSTKKPAVRRATPARSARKMGTLSVEQSAPVDALRLLEQDHQEVEALFSQYKNLDGARERAAMAAKICLLLKVHTQIEEEILYPAAREVMDEDDLVDEAEVEHTSAKQLIAQIEAMAPRDHLFDAKVNVLGEYVHHHVEEERTELFPVLRDTELDFYAIGAQLTERKLALLAKLTGKA